MSYFGEVCSVWRMVFGKKKYFVLALVAAFLFYLLNGLILNLNNVGTLYNVFGLFGTVEILFLLSLRFYDNIMPWGMFWTILLSILIGMLVSLLFYRGRFLGARKKNSGIFGGLGVFLGAAAPGCAACGVGLLSLIGFGSALAVLPFGGHEIIVLAVGLVLFSVVKISGKLYNPKCSVNRMENSLSVQQEAAHSSSFVSQKKMKGGKNINE